MRFDAHAARSNIHVGNSNERPAAAPSRLHRATLPLAFSTTSWIWTVHPAQGCHRYMTSRFSVLWVFWSCEARTHLSLHKDAPIARAAQTVGRVLPVPILGGLHHQYIRV
jgi:hypothetical protein